MKARVKATGEIGIVSQIDVLLKDDFVSFSPNNVELMTNYVDKTEDYWEKLKHQYAGMAMQGILSNPESELDYIGDETLPQALARCSAKLAHFLVEELKSESNEK